MVRDGRVLIDASTGKPDFGRGYYVTAFEVGAQVTSASSGTTITVRAGHRFAANDFFIVGIDESTYRRVLSVTSTTLEVNIATSVSQDDVLVNLGTDGGGNSPDYTGSGLVTYTDMDYSDVAKDATVLTDSDGRYIYYHKGIEAWEFVRDSSGAPVAVYQGAVLTVDEQQVSHEIRYAHLFATGGTGTPSDPWTVSGSNPVQAAIDDLPSYGGTVEMIVGHFDLGSADPAVTIPILTSATDVRAYHLVGAGRDLTFLRYSGTGSAIRYPQVNTGSVGNSWQSNRNVFSGFSLLQVGTARTGNGIYLSYGGNTLFEELSVGCSRANQSAGEDDNGFSYGLRFEGPASDEVADFNTFRGCFFLGNTLGVDMTNQCDNAKFYDCHFEPRQDVNVSQNGLALGNGQGWTLSGCHFNYFDYDSNAYGVRLNTVVQGVDIHGCYFEGNSNGVYLYTDGNQKGIHIHGNFFTGASTTTAYGIRAGIDGGTFTVKGLVIEANSFAGLGTSEVGIRIGSDVKDFKLIGNAYDISGGGTEVVLQTGCQGIRSEPTATSTAYPRIQLVDSDQDQGHIILLTNKASAVFSPRLYFAPGNSGNVFSLSADSSGTLTGKKNDGTTVFQLAQTGAMSLVGALAEAANGTMTGASGSTWVRGYAEENLVLSTGGTTTNTAANLLPAGALILGVVARVTTTIGTATDWKLGDSTTAARFCAAQSGGQLTANAVIVGIDHWSGAVTTLAAGPSQAAAATVRVTTTGTPSAGRIKIGVYYAQFTAPTS